MLFNSCDMRALVNQVIGLFDVPGTAKELWMTKVDCLP